MGANSLTYVRWYFDAIEDCRGMLTNEQMGELFFAIASYAQTGERVTVSDEIRWPFHEHCRRIDATKKSYAAKCETAAKNGAAGGRAKARNAAKTKAEADGDRGSTNKFTPPTKSEFKAMAKHLADDNQLEFDDYELNEFYAQLDEAGWKIDGEPVAHMSTIKAAICVRFSSEPYFGSIINDWNCFTMLFSGTNGKHGYLDDFAGTYEPRTDGKTGQWRIGSNVYSTLRAAVDAFIANLADASEC